MWSGSFHVHADLPMVTKPLLVQTSEEIAFVSLAPSDKDMCVCLFFLEPGTAASSTSFTPQD